MRDFDVSVHREVCCRDKEALCARTLWRPEKHGAMRTDAHVRNRTTRTEFRALDTARPVRLGGHVAKLRDDQTLIAPPRRLAASPNCSCVLLLSAAYSIARSRAPLGAHGAVVASDYPRERTD